MAITRSWEPDGTTLRIVNDDDPTAIKILLVPAEALGSWGALLGYDDDEEVLAAIQHVFANGEPEPDPVTGVNAWTGVWRAWQDLLQAEVRQELATAPNREVPLKAEPIVMARMSAPPPEDDLDALATAVTDAQAETRSTLGLPEPGARVMARSARTADSTLSDGAERIKNARARFLRALTPQEMETRWTSPDPPTSL